MNDMDLPLQLVVMFLTSINIWFHGSLIPQKTHSKPFWPILPLCNIKCHNWTAVFYLQGQMYKQLYKVFLAVYPYVHMSWEGSLLAYQVAYMLGKISWHSPLLHLSGTKLCHTEGEEEDVLHSLPFSQLWSSARYNSVVLVTFSPFKYTGNSSPKTITEKRLKLNFRFWKFLFIFLQKFLKNCKFIQFANSKSNTKNLFYFQS